MSVCQRAEGKPKQLTGFEQKDNVPSHLPHRTADGVQRELQ